MARPWCTAAYDGWDEPVAAGIRSSDRGRRIGRAPVPARKVPRLPRPGGTRSGRLGPARPLEGCGDPALGLILARPAPAARWGAIRELIRWAAPGSPSCRGPGSSFTAAARGFRLFRASERASWGLFGGRTPRGGLLGEWVAGGTVCWRCLLCGHALIALLGRVLGPRIWRTRYSSAPSISTRRMDASRRHLLPTWRLLRAELGGRVTCLE